VNKDKKKMQMRKLGKSNLEVSAIGFGCLEDAKTQKRAVDRLASASDGQRNVVDLIVHSEVVPMVNQEAPYRG
jgi:hypothetical protein